MDQVSKHSDEERASLGSNGKTSTRALGKIGSTLRNSIRRAAERSPLSPGSKGLKVTPPSPSEYRQKKSKPLLGKAVVEDPRTLRWG